MGDGEDFMKPVMIERRISRLESRMKTLEDRVGVGNGGGLIAELEELMSSNRGIRRAIAALSRRMSEFEELLIGGDGQ